MLDLEHARYLMVERQLRGRGVTDDLVLDAMRRVPREVFVPEEMQEFAYEDTPLPIEAGQTISQPYIVGLMIEAAAIGPGDRVLEIGSGSGYAAAIMSRVAGQVYAIERHAELTKLASARLERLGYANVEMRTGDGTLGWPEAQPFDAILAAAGGPDIPRSLKEQLAIGGRLIMPVGDTTHRQRLMKLTRTGQDSFQEDDLGEVRFVPMIGRHAWNEDGAKPAGERLAEPRRVEASQREMPLPQMIGRAAEPLPQLNDPAFGKLFDRFAAAKVVLLGESTHGTSEFYRARCEITRRLITEHGFRTVAVEADWPDAASVDRHVRHRPPKGGAPFQRFPTWMWRNTDVQAFIEWMRAWNAGRAGPDQASFNGLDLYNLSGSIQAVIDYLDRVDPQAGKVARQRYGCLTPWAKEPQAYGRMAITRGYAFCEEGVVAMLREILDRQVQYTSQDGENFLDAASNARLVQNAEAYYRAMYYGAAESWNLRDTHMFETLCALLDAKGEGAKAVVWAHNSHIGNAAFTEMGVSRDELNIGQLARERFGADAALIGFGADTGNVACASDWGSPMEVKELRPSRPDSYERLAHDAGVERFLLDLRAGVHEPLRSRLLEPRLERFVGVIYRPETERWSHYSECSLPRQFDAYVYYDTTTAVTSLPAAEPAGGPGETYPFGL